MTPGERDDNLARVAKLLGDVRLENGFSILGPARRTDDGRLVAFVRSPPVHVCAPMEFAEKDGEGFVRARVTQAYDQASALYRDLCGAVRPQSDFTGQRG